MDSWKYAERKIKGRAPGRLKPTVCCLLAAGMLLTGCGKQPPYQPNQQGGTVNMQSSAKNAGKNGGGNVKTFSYSDKHMTKLRDAAHAIQMKTVYVPQAGPSGDKLDWVEVDNNVMILHYKKMEITEYQQEIKPFGLSKNERDIQLTNGTARWMTTGGRDRLHMKMPEGYVVLTADKDVAKEEIERTAESLVPMQIPAK